MIVLDANVVSEMVRDAPDPRVLEWLDGIRASQACVTAVVLAELSAGVAVLPAGTRRDQLQSSLHRVLAGLSGHVIPFDEASASEYADVFASRRRMGRPASVLDAQIAATCRAHRLPLATRNVKDFEGLGLGLINPWQPPGK
ncbi:type II toxin-antitoxin system VapC family toxin [Luteipulveratus mongoliensis]|uniref:Ribonuclease VapC n=1 Tax=Luteipulveratus mongoliensis TaxID=571913 RepID=A0A0K1JJF9_9MICO|nr:type II toxin-antitoxin system VapC family toxin [Luteipulveratus mongoliensis]AKU16713.1 hypothetical protein VV02_13980 [Luteipulveratus mongoliensis]